MPIIDESSLDPIGQSDNSGGYIIDESQLDPTPSWQDYALGGLKGIAKSATDIFTAPANLLTRGGVAAIDALTGQEHDTAGMLPSDYVNRFLNWESQGRGNQTTEDVTRLLGNLGSAVAVPSQAGNIAKGVTKAIPYMPGLLSKAIGLGTEGIGYNALFQSDQENPLKGSGLAAGLNIAIPAAGNIAGKVLDKLIPSRTIGPMAKAIQSEFQSITPGALTEAISPAERANLAINALEKSGTAQEDLASAMFKSLPKENVNLEPAINAIQDAQLKYGGPIQPGSGISRILNYLEGFRTPAQEIPTQFSTRIINPFESQAPKIIPAKPAMATLDQVQNIVRDIGQRGIGEQPVPAAMLSAAKSAVMSAAEKDLKPETMKAWLGARSAWREMAQSYKSGAVGAVRESADIGGRLNTFKNKLLNDPKAAQELSRVMSPEELNNAQHLMLSDLTLMSPVSWERSISKKIDSYKAIFGEEKTNRLLQMVSRDGTIGKHLLKDNNGLASLLAKTGVKSTVGALIGYESGGGMKGALAGAVLGSALSQGGKAVNRAKSLVMMAAAGSPEAVKILNTPATKMKIGEAVGRLATILRAKASQSTRPIEQAYNEIQAKKELTREEVNKLGQFGPKDIQAKMELRVRELMKGQGMSEEQAKEQVYQEMKNAETPKVDPSNIKPIVEAVIQQESAGNPKAISKVGAQGLMQLMPETGKELFKKAGLSGEYDPYNAEQNKKLGTLYLKELVDRYDGDIKLALAAYNYGLGRIDKLLRQNNAKTFEDIHRFLPTETQKYVPGVLSKIKNSGTVET